MNRYLSLETRRWPFAFAALLLSVAMHYERTFDWAIQEAFFRNQRWLLDQNEPLGRLFFYQAPKYLLVALGIYLLAEAAVRYRARNSEFSHSVFGLCCLALIPAVIGAGKYLTDEPCPSEVAIFGGLLQPGMFTGRCFPAGHASGGFALFFLYWYLGQRRLALLPGLVAGTVTGAYQILKGSHFVSDTIFTAALAWILCQALWPLTNWIGRRFPYEEEKKS